MIFSLSTLLASCLAVNLAVTIPRSPTEPIETMTKSTTDSEPFDLDFPGGTMQAYVGAIREKIHDANIIIMPDAMNISMPAVLLKSVDLHGALAFLDNLIVGSDYLAVPL